MNIFRAMLKWTATLLPVAAFVALFSLTAGDPRLSMKAFVGWSWHIVASLFLLWMVLAVKLLLQKGFSLSALLRSSWKGLLAALLLTLFVGLTVEDEFRVLADETNQVDTARSLFLHREARSASQGFYGPDSAFTNLEEFLPKRPLLFPLLGSLAHHLFGESDRNLFRVNMAVLFALLLLAYGAGKHFLGEVAGLTAMFLVLSNPAVSLFARSAGFDLLSALGFFTAMALLYLYLRKPSPGLLAFLWVTMLLYSHVRYENFMYLPVVFGTLILLGGLRREDLPPNLPLLAAGPFFLLPLVWQFSLSRGQYENPEGVPLFGLGHFAVNAGRLLTTQLDFNFAFQSAFSDFCLPLFLLTALVLLAARLSGSLSIPQRWQRVFAAVLGISLAVNVAVFLSLVHGDITFRLSQRFFLTSFIFFSVFPLALLFLPGGRVRRLLLAALALFLVLLYHPVATHRSAHSLYYIDIEQQRRFLAGYEKEKTLVVAPQPDRLCALGYGAVQPATFTAGRRWFLEQMDRGTWKDVVFFQEVNSVTRRIEAESRLFPGLKLKRIGTFYIEPNLYMKISTPRQGNALQLRSGA